MPSIRLTTSLPRLPERAAAVQVLGEPSGTVTFSVTGFMPSRDSVTW